MKPCSVDEVMVLLSELFYFLAQGTVDPNAFGPIPPIECIPNTPDSADILVGCDAQGYPEGRTEKPKKAVVPKVIS